MKQTEWKIIYTNYKAITKRTVHFLSKELGRLLIREPFVYRIYVLPCEKEGCEISKNAVFVGCYDDSELIRNYVSEDEVPKDGFLVKVIKNPDDSEGRFVILTAHTENELFYAAVSFLDDYMPKYAPARALDLFFDSPLNECSYTDIPDNKRRSIFTWGHSINDYRAYIDNMARLRFNELILWNDYIPLNIEDIIDYAHSYGIKVILGYSWGWKEIGRKTGDFSDESINSVKELAIREYRDRYSKVNCDGIYFQTFTERQEQSVAGRLVSRLVVDMVNDIGASLWKINPDLRIIFGLHASSVRNHLDDIERVDKRMEIMWEDCGEFPYSYASCVEDEDKYIETLDFTKKILELRGGIGVGIVFKGVMMLDWTKFVYQRGPYIMGENSKDIAMHDKCVRSKIWRSFAADWMRNGDRAQEMLLFIKKNKLADVDICLAGTFDGGIYLPVALCAEMYRKCDGKYSEILQRVSKRNCITVD